MQYTSCKSSPKIQLVSQADASTHTHTHTHTVSTVVRSFRATWLQRPSSKDKSLQVPARRASIHKTCRGIRSIQVASSTQKPLPTRDQVYMCRADNVPTGHSTKAHVMYMYSNGQPTQLGHDDAASCAARLHVREERGGWESD